MFEVSIINIATLLGVIGCIYVSYNKPLIANLVWIVGNPMMLYHNLQVGETEQARMWVVYIFIAAIGIYKSRKIIIKKVKSWL
jgi:hypothetical protein